MRASKARIAAAVDGVGHDPVTELFGVGPVVAAMVIGYTGDVRRFANRDHSAGYTGTSPVAVSSGERIMHRLYGPGTVNSITRSTSRRSPRSARALTGARLRPQGRRGQNQARSVGAQATISDAIYRQLLHDAANMGPGGQTGTASGIQRDRPRTPTAGASEEPLPDPTQR